MTQRDQSDFAVDTEATSNEKLVIRAEDLAFSKRERWTTKDQGVVEKINRVWTEASKEGPLTNLRLDDAALNGREICIDGKKLIHFGSCAYLGLEFDSTFCNAGIEALCHFGTQFSSSATYLELSLYEKLRTELKKIFLSDVVIAPTTTLAHFSSIPVMVGKNDVILLDQMVHTSVQMATKLAKTALIKTIPHNNLEELERHIVKFGRSSEKIWYFLDGVYSMYGDFAPLAELCRLKTIYPNFYLYIDDAHGMGWTGENGCGYAWSNIENKDRVVLATSLSKSFSVGGAAIVCSDSSLLKSIWKFGPSLIFGGPLHPVLLGISLQSAKFHQTETLNQYQSDILKKIYFRNKLLEQFEIPVAHVSKSPISFVHIGDHIKTGQIFNRLKQHGFYLNSSMYPAVSNRQSGLRFTVSRHIRLADISSLISQLRVELDLLG